MARGLHGGAAVGQGLACCFPMASLMPTNPYNPAANEPVIRTPKPANALTLEELNEWKHRTADAISNILNRFSAETSLRVESVDLDIAVIYGGQQRYSATLGVRL